MPALDPSTWVSLRALEAAGEPGFLKDLVDEFMATSPERMARLKQALEKEDAGALEREAHAFKSSCATLGAKAAAGVLQEIETLGRQQRAGAAAAAVATLEHDLEQVCGELKAAAGLR